MTCPGLPAGKVAFSSSNLSIWLDIGWQSPKKWMLCFFKMLECTVWLCESWFCALKPVISFLFSWFVLLYIASLWFFGGGCLPNVKIRSQVYLMNIWTQCLFFYNMHRNVLELDLTKISLALNLLSDYTLLTNFTWHKFTVQQQKMNVVPKNIQQDPEGHENEDLFYFFILSIYIISVVMSWYNQLKVIFTSLFPSALLSMFTQRCFVSKWDYITVRIRSHSTHTHKHTFPSWTVPL